MRYHERLNIMLMRDKGPRHGFSIQRNHFYLLVLFFGCLPFLCLLLAIQCWFLWQDNIKLNESMEKFELEQQAAEARAERLENLEELLREQNVPARDLLIKQLASDDKSSRTHENTDIAEEEAPPLEDGPGHEEFPEINTGRINIANVQARALKGHTLRIGLDLRNPDPEHLLIGEVEVQLITAAGDKINLDFTPADVGNFRISRFKRTVMLAKVQRDVSLINAQVIVEVKTQEDELIYRNIFDVQR